MDAAYNAGPRGYWTQTNALLKTGKELERELHAALEKIADQNQELALYRSNIGWVPAHIDGVTLHIEANP